MLLVSLRTADTVVAFAVGVAAASYVTFRASRAHLKLDPFLSSAFGRAFLLALIWLLVFSAAFMAIYWPYAKIWTPS